MAEDLRVSIIVDATAAERQLRAVEAQAKQVAASMTSVGTAAEGAARAVSQSTNAAIGDMRRLGNEAERAAAKVAALNRAYTSGVNARQIGRNSPSPFPAATGGGYDGGDGAGIGFGGLGGPSGYGAAGGAALAGYAINYVREGGVNYAESFDSAFSPEARALGGQTSFQAAKTLGVNASAAFDSYAAALKKTSDALTEAERKQAVLNAAMGKGAAIVAASAAYQNTPGGTLAGIKEFGSNLQEAVFLRFQALLTGSFGSPVGSERLYDARGLAAGQADQFGAGFGAIIKSRFGAFQAGIDAQHASNAAFFARNGGFDPNAIYSPGGIAAFNQSQYADAATRYRAQLAAGQSSYLGGVNALVGLENQRGRFNESLQFRPGASYTGTETIFGETGAERTLRIFADADRFYGSDPKGRASFLALQAGNLDPASLSADQRDTIRQALDQSIIDQVALLKDQTAVLRGIKELLDNAVKKATGGPGHEYDATPTPDFTAIIRNDSDTAVSIRFADQAPNTFTNTSDTLSQDNY